MKFIVFASSIHLDLLSGTKDVEEFLTNVLEYYVMTIRRDNVDNQEEDYQIAFKKIERYGSFMYISEEKYNKLLPNSDEE